jgi:hypothetical protein
MIKFILQDNNHYIKLNNLGDAEMHRMLGDA